jgi:serine-type D-Ala-D-Ala carboxypeptidase/endopeptidase
LEPITPIRSFQELTNDFALSSCSWFDSNADCYAPAVRAGATAPRNDPMEKNDLMQRAADMPRSQIPIERRRTAPERVACCIATLPKRHTPLLRRRTGRKGLYLYEPGDPAGVCVLPVIAIHTAIVYWLFRGNLRKGYRSVRCVTSDLRLRRPAVVALPRPFANVLLRRKCQCGTLGPVESFRGSGRSTGGAEELMNRTLCAPIGLFAGVVMGVVLFGTKTLADSKLLNETVEFTGTVLFLQSRVPALVIGVVRDDETAVFGFGETSDGSGKPPDRHTLLRVGSLTKAFTGQVLASLVADGTVRFTDRLQDRIGWNVTIPSRAGREIKLIDLVTHSSGLPREVERELGPPGDPFSTLTPEIYRKALGADPLVFTPGTGALYSNFGYDVLSAALSHAAGKPYDALLKERVLDPAGLKDTVLSLRAGDHTRLLQGHNFDGKPLPDVETPLIAAGASGIYSTPDDVLRWLSWHLDRFASKDAEVRLLDHAAYLQRDGLNPVFGFDESGHMDAIGLGWVVMAPRGNLPLILQKAGGLQGVFTYTAFAPTRGVGAFVAINKFDFGAAMAMAGVVNQLIGELAPR